MTLATGAAERDAAGTVVRRLRRGTTLGADKGCDAREFVAQLRARASNRTPPTGGAPSTAARRGIRGTRSASGPVGGWRRS